MITTERYNELKKQHLDAISKNDYSKMIIEGDDLYYEILKYEMNVLNKKIEKNEIFNER